MTETKTRIVLGAIARELTNARSSHTTRRTLIRAAKAAQAAGRIADRAAQRLAAEAGRTDSRQQEQQR